MANLISALLWPVLLLSLQLLIVEGGRGPLTSFKSDYLEVPASRSSVITERSVTLSERSDCGAEDEHPPTRVFTTERVQNLMAELVANNYNAYIIPSGDAHQSEYVAERDERRAYISGFSGSAGTAVVLVNGTRALWTDSRYFLEADMELDCEWLLMKTGDDGVPTIEEFLIDNLETGNVVAADSNLIGYSTWLTYSSDLQAEGITLVSSLSNLVDTVWDADTVNVRPPYSNATAFVHDIQYAGQSVSDKLAEVRAELAIQSAEGLFLTALDEVAWLYNVRGADVTYNPVLRSYALVTTTDAFLFVDNEKITQEVQEHLDTFSVTVRPYEDALPDLTALSSSADITNLLLPASNLSPGCSFEVYNTVDANKRTMVTPPTLLLKAQKNEVEIEQMLAFHVLDAVALCDWMAFIETEVQAGENWTERTAQDLLTEYRAQQEGFVDLSFEAISAYEANGAIVHYAADSNTALPLGTDSLYLVDSGGQYYGATTDVTRTMHFGTPTDEMIEMNTRVLMGTIDLGSAVFRAGTHFYEIDILARRHLHEVGRNYGHGTSHGIGMFLNVHEPIPSEFQPRYVMSDEPGYYEEGEYGIRIENQVYVMEMTNFSMDATTYYTFGHMTLVPFEPKLIDIDLLSDAQIQWINDYHQTIREKVGPVMTAQNRTDGYNWLMSKTEPIEREGPMYTQCPDTTDGATVVTMAYSLAVLVAAMAFRNLL